MENKSQLNNPPVLIAGAGPTGITAAMELSRLGVPVVIIDKADGPSTTSRALAVQSRTLELFQQRGLAEQMTAKGNPAIATTIYNETKVLGRVDLKLIQSRYNYCLLIPQSDTEGILRSQLEKQGVIIRWKTEMTGFTQHEENNGMEVILKNPDGNRETLTASYLISAEGAHSLSRRLLGLTFEGKTMGQNYALGDLHIEGEIPEDELSVFVSKKGFLATFPLGNKRYRLMVTDPENQSKTAAPPTMEYLQHLYDQVVHIPARLYDMNWTSRYGINSRMMETLRAGNVFFGGDSAHIHSPAGGQGMNTGIQDMINLCWKLAYVIKGLAKDGLLDTYQQERVSVIKSLLNTTEKATDLFNSLNPLVYTLMSALMPPLLNLGLVQKKGTAVISETANEYTGGSLSGHNGTLGELKAGVRLPDTRLLVNCLNLNTGSRLKDAALYDLLNPSLFTLLVFNKDGIQDSDLPAPKDQLVVLTVTAADDIYRQEYETLFGQAPGFLLVRPDSYIAIAGKMLAIDSVSEWFTKAGINLD